MGAVFLFGTLCHLPLLRAVAGSDLDRRKALLPRTRVMQAAGENWPLLVQDGAAQIEGILIDPDPEALARLDFYEACFGSARQPATVVLDGVDTPAEIWAPRAGQAAPAGPWDLAGWARDWGDLAVVAAREVMVQRAHATPQEVGARYWMIAARAQSWLSAQAWQRPDLIGQGPGRDTVDVVAQRVPYAKFFTVEELAIRHRQFDGTPSPLHERAVFRVADAVTVLPYDPGRDRILLVEQLRLGAFAHGDPRPWLLEPVAGMIDAGEPPEAAARRETLEEAGLTLGALHPVARYYPSPGGIAQVMTSYIGIADLPDDVTGIGGHLSEGEDILSHLVPYDLAVRMLAQGDMANAPLVLSMQWLMMNRDRLRENA